MLVDLRCGPSSPQCSKVGLPTAPSTSKKLRQQQQASLHSVSRGALLATRIVSLILMRHCAKAVWLRAIIPYRATPPACARATTAVVSIEWYEFLFQ
eukprot:3203392-Amphidinium_carterae.1